MKRTLERAKRLRRMMLALWVLTLIPTAAGAYRSPLEDSREDYGAGVGRKLGRGVANTGLGWTEVFRGMRDVTGENGFWAGATWGPIYGTVNAIQRTATGLYETATFPLQGPNRFEPILEPEFPLSEQ